MQRREFMTRLAATTAIVTSALSTRRIAGANDRVRVALIGCGGRGRLLAGLAAQVPGVEIVAACDVYGQNMAAAQKQIGAGCRPIRDFRQILDNRDVDAVIIATPDHWHALQTVLACRAGKDVYVEKPAGYTVREGRQMVEAAREHRTVVQHGTQQRSAAHYAEAARLVQRGDLGDVRLVRIWNFVNMHPDGIGTAEDGTAPPDADWDAFLGPAPYVPFNRRRFVGTYRWFWDYGGGLVTDFGVHRFDSLHQVMDVTAPLTATASGGRYALRDGGETPDVVQVTYEYPGFVLSYEATLLSAAGTGPRTPGRAYYGARGATDRPHGEAYYGTNGTLLIDRIGFEILPELNGTTGPGAVPRPNPDGLRMKPSDMAVEDATAAHVANFVDCVRTRRPPVAPLEAGHRSSTVAHLGNIAYRTGRKIRWRADTEQILDDADASRLLEREPREKWRLA